MQTNLTPPLHFTAAKPTRPSSAQAMKGLAQQVEQTRPGDGANPTDSVALSEKALTVTRNPEAETKAKKLDGIFSEFSWWNKSDEIEPLLGTSSQAESVAQAYYSQRKFPLSHKLFSEEYDDSLAIGQVEHYEKQHSLRSEHHEYPPVTSRFDIYKMSGETSMSSEEANRIAADVKGHIDDNYKGRIGRTPSFDPDSFEGLYESLSGLSPGDLKAVTRAYETSQGGDLVVELKRDTYASEPILQDLFSGNQARADARRLNDLYYNRGTQEEFSALINELDSEELKNVSREYLKLPNGTFGLSRTLEVRKYADKAKLEESRKIDAELKQEPFYQDMLKQQQAKSDARKTDEAEMARAKAQAAKVAEEKAKANPPTRFELGQRATQLREAMKGLGTNKTAVYGALQGLHGESRAQLIDVYKEITDGRDLIRDIRRDFSGAQERKALSYLKSAEDSNIFND